MEPPPWMLLDVIHTYIHIYIHTYICGGAFSIKEIAVRNGEGNKVQIPDEAVCISLCMNTLGKMYDLSVFLLFGKIVGQTDFFALV